MKNAFLIFPILCFLSAPLWAAETADAPEEKTVQAASPCQMDDRVCVLKQIEETAEAIDNKSWHDQTLRELAKTYAFEGDTDKAISLIAKIQTPDTQAMTIRGIGMAAAGNELSQEQYDELFAKLRKAAETISHPPSYAIALTYIAMAQAFAEDDEGAWKTAADMENDALRHKAFGETAEIQAERGDFDAAMHSIEQIDSEAYRNKAYNIVAKLLADRKLFQEALNAAANITNAYKKAETMQYILDIQKPRAVERGG
ncbi:MAG: hypothetical protein LRZ85_06540 [Alphaproteobacteria bacterium]|nr:hypothetical protein [Alphaproteobacteria bacterium]MCD8526313.1 hypothetical protein [Alphaproteobacteria bacterium]MCD8571527.1 hypothetical protein [Alphaproteobacteria bacterium]